MSNRIPPSVRVHIADKIRRVMKPYVKGQGEWAECVEAAHSLNLNPWTVWAWYNGRHLPMLYNLIRFADLYEVSIDYLLGRLNEPSIVALRARVAQLRKVA